MRIEFWWEYPKERDYLEKLREDGDNNIKIYVKINRIGWRGLDLYGKDREN
jgi:hypothetical protein